MKESVTRKTVAFLLTGLVWLAMPTTSSAVSPAKLSGAIAGLVTDISGVPQMGASVFLFNRQDRLFQRVLTDERGMFVFPGLVPDLYSVRVTLASFLPAIKENILVQPGVRSMLNVSLANLFSSIQLVYSSPEQRGLMNDDWKWVLRAASSTRPVVRLLPRIKVDSPQEHHAVFSDTRGLLRLSAGDGGSASNGSEPDLGTAFALATSVFRSNQLQFSGNVGYGSQSGVPAAAFRTSFSRDTAIGQPEFSVTMRQLALPLRAGAAFAGSETAGMPALRSMSVSLDDRAHLSDNLTLQYGFSFDGVTFLDRLNYFSPYARLTYSLGDAGELEFSYTSGNARPDLAGVPTGGPEAALQRDLRSLSMFPRVSLMDGKAKVQRGENFEIGYSRTAGSRTYRVWGYRESVRNAALIVSDPDNVFPSTDLLPDLFSGSAIFNAGDYQTLGYIASVTQNVGGQLSATLMYGSVGALTPAPGVIESESPDQLRSMIHAGRKHALTARVTATSPWTGTHLVASYQWADLRSATPGPLYSTQSVRPDPGFNVYVRQPLPSFWVLPWRMEATADLRNLLAQGYLPLSLADGRSIVLVQNPRSFRGGLSFIF